jgi:hypothetical protein
LNARQIPNTTLSFHMGVVAFDKYSTGRRRRDYQANLADQDRLRESLMESVRTIFAGYVEFLLLIIL